MSAVVQHPRAAELVARHKLRRKVEAAVDRLLAILDDLDGDPDAEPLLGSPELAAECRCHVWTPDGARMVALMWGRGANDDREEENEQGDDLDRGEADPSDHEPSLGAAENHHDQRHWAAGDRRDREDGGDTEPVDEREPNDEGDDLVKVTI